MKAVPRRRLKAATAVLAATSLWLLVGVAPAGAAGAGATTGHSDIAASGPVTNPLCIRSNANPTITLTNVGSVEVGVGVYVGATVATIPLAQFYFGPEAAYPNPGCGLPGPVTVTGASVVSSTPNGSGGSVSCTNLSGEYRRVTNAFTITVSGSCTVTGPAGTGTGAATFVFSGNQNPCLGDFGVPNCEPPVQDTEFEGAYTQA